MEIWDWVVIGGGSGGIRAARIAAGLGARVALVEAKDLGGTCVHLGCVPKKLLVYGASYAEHLEDARGYGWEVGACEHDWSQLIHQKDRELERLKGVYQRMLERAGVEWVRGFGRILAPGLVEVDGRQLSTRGILIATGGRPWRPDIPGAEHGVSSDQIFHLPELPPRIAVVGAGYIGVEFASIFRGLGREVHLIHRSPSLLRGFDRDLQEALESSFETRGMMRYPERNVLGVEKSDSGLLLTLDDEQSLEVDLLLWATGRRPATEGVGLEAIGVDRNAQGGVLVDAEFETSVPGIHAVGDVIQRAELTPVALAEGMRLAQKLFGDQAISPLHYEDIPTAVFTTPPLATVGLTEQEARARGIQPRIFRARFRPMKHTLSGRESRVMVKLVVDPESDRVLGCHMMGEAAGEIIQGLAVALQAGATKAQFDATLGIHPTTAEEFVTMRSPVS